MVLGCSILLFFPFSLSSLALSLSLSLSFSPFFLLSFFLALFVLYYLPSFTCFWFPFAAGDACTPLINFFFFCHFDRDGKKRDFDVVPDPNVPYNTFFCLRGLRPQVAHCTKVVVEAMNFFQNILGLDSFPYDSYQVVFLDESYSEMCTYASLSILK